MQDPGKKEGNDEGTPRLRLVFALWDGGGNVPPLASVMKQMVQKGHQVRAVGHVSIRKPIEESGARFVPYWHAPSHAAALPTEDSIRTWQARTSLGYLQRMRDRLMFGPAAAYARDLLEELDRSPADAVVADFLLPGALLAAESRRLPAAALVHTVYTLPAPGLPPVGRGYEPARNRLGKVRDGVLKGMVKMLFNRRLNTLNQTRRDLGLDEIEDAMDIYRRIERVLVLTYKAFDFPAESYPSNTCFVGPQPPIKAFGEAARAVAPNAVPFVVATFSTNFARQEPLVKKTIEALAALPVRSLVTAPVIDMSRVTSRANVEVRRFVPHEQVFPKAHLVITHGGHGTVIKALSHGTPLICLPCDHDQFDIAVRVASRGAGITLPRNVGVTTLRTTVTKMLSDSRFRLAALRLAESFEREDHGSVVEEIEAMAAAGWGKGAD